MGPDYHGATLMEMMSPDPQDPHGVLMLFTVQVSFKLITIYIHVIKLTYHFTWDLITMARFHGNDVT